jgi:RsiW-degrading membrane proteinase PrsW (M82 family)
MVVVVLIASALLGIASEKLLAHARTPLDRARHLARSGELVAAEEAYLQIVDAHPGDVPTIVELLDVHAHLDEAASEEHEGPEPVPNADKPRAAKHVGKGVDESRIDAVVASPALSGDAAFVVRWWRAVLDHASSSDDDKSVVAMADREPPAPWANHLLGRQTQFEGDLPGAAKRFGREGASFDGRREDVEDACRIWAGVNDWEALAAALGRPRFAAQVSASTRMEEAMHRHDWLQVVRWFLPAQYEGTGWGVALLAGLAGLVWVVICAVIGRVDERTLFRAPLYLSAIVLGVASTYLTIALVLLEEHALHFVERGEPASDAIYFVVGVGLREELAKMALLLPLVLIIKRWGRRREALTCGALVGLGFAAEENIGYFHLGLATALARFLTANFLHISTTGLVAVSLDDAARGRSEEATSLSRTLPLVVITHGMWDFLATDGAIFGQLGGYLSMITFVFLARRFGDVIRGLPGREGPLLRVFAVGLAVVAGGTYIYAASLVGPALAAEALAEGALGLVVTIYVFAQELARVG